MKTFMRGHKQDYFVILLASIMLVIVFGLVYVTFTSKPPNETVVLPPTPQPTTTSSNTLPVQYDNAAEDRLAQKINNRPTLSPADQQQKSTTLTNTVHGFNSGVVYETTNVRLEYIQSADMFMGEIKTTSVVKAKAEANTWLLNQGFTQEGICNLPVMFYLDPEVSQALQGQDVIFSPLPNGC